LQEDCLSDVGLPASAPRLVEQLEQTADALEAQQASTMKHQIEVGAIETINETQKELEQARGGDQECGLRACMVSSPWLLCGVVARLRQSSAGHFLENSKTEKYCVHVRIAVLTFCSINVVYVVVFVPCILSTRSSACVFCCGFGALFCVW